MKKYKIAFTGTFDIDNFGDHLFPIIFKKYLLLKGIDIIMDLYSPFEAIEGFNLGNKIYSLESLLSKNKEIKYDAVVVGGGELLHLNSFKHMNHVNQYIDYPIFETWIVPSLITEKDTRIIWNNIGCPFEFEEFEADIIKKIITNVDYLSLRNEYSKNIIKKYRNNVYQSFDTAFLLPKIYEKNNLKKIIKGKYIIYHCNKTISSDFYNESLDVLKTLSKQYKIVLLPLAYTNEDDSIAKKLYADSQHQFHLISEKLSLKDIIALLAHCELYIGVSYHGAITSYAYNNKIIGYDYFNNKKTQDLFNDLNLKDYYINQPGQLLKIVTKVLNDNWDFSNNMVITQNLDAHFDNIINILNSQSKIKKIDLSIKDITQFITHISLFKQEKSKTLYDVCRENIILKDQKDYFEKEFREYFGHWHQCNEEMKKLRISYNNLQEEYETLKHRKLIKRIFNK